MQIIKEMKTWSQETANTKRPKSALSTDKNIMCNLKKL